MKVLFAPSEAKSAVKGNLKHPNFSFNSDKREIVLNEYESFINTTSDLANFFGLKDEELVAHYKTSFKENVGIKAVLRYTGVAYKALDYPSLDESAKKYVDENVVIFSNLFGPLLAKDPLPEYKFKQGAKLPNFNVEKFYKDNFSQALDEFLEDDDILDLRAGFYEKFYTIKKPYLTLKFIKDSKVVSHYAKHYRGEILRQIAFKNVKNFGELMETEFENLKLSEIKEQKNKKEIVFEIYT
ncbi:MAG: YaaA family protein [Campylobacteraceae bacterium]|nr:YaaA family protein [Campylobacteraceae bacterium]